MTRRKAIRFDAEALVRSVEAVRDAVRDGVPGRRKAALRTAAVKLPPPAPPSAAAEIAREHPDILEAA